jgi:hypothetical protein
MTLQIPLTADLENRLLREAERHGMAPADYTLQLLKQHLPSENKRSELVALIQSWIDEGDTAEQISTGEYLIEALDADRPSERKLFPPELQGVTW